MIVAGSTPSGDAVKAAMPPASASTPAPTMFFERLIMLDVIDDPPPDVALLAAAICRTGCRAERSDDVGECDWRRDRTDDADTAPDGTKRGASGVMAYAVASAAKPHVMQKAERVSIAVGRVEVCR